MSIENPARSSRRVTFQGPWVIGFFVLFLGLLAMPSAGFAEDVVSQGKWTKKGYSVEGSWKIVSSGGGYVLKLSEGFSTKKAPDLKLFLSNRSVADLSNRNAIDGAVLIAPLKSHRGAQEYRLPGSADPKAFNTLVLHCEKYTKLWAAAPL